jgi:hypothetical protein
MVAREYIKEQADILPESIIEKIIEFISFQKFRFGYDDETDYLLSIPGMFDKIEAASKEPLSEGVPTV